MVKVDGNADVGRTIGCLTALEIDEETSKQKKRTHYRCSCTCGRTKSVPRKDFLAGKVPTCGDEVHRKQKAQKKYIGKRSGCYEVISQNVIQPHLYECRCTLCGFTQMVSRSSLNTYLRGEVCDSCVNCRYNIGHQYGKLTIVDKDTEMSAITCHCTCGNEVAYSLDDFKEKKPRSCGRCSCKLPTEPINAEQSALVVEYHDRIYKFMRLYRLVEGEWYDYLSLILIKLAMEYTSKQIDIPFPGVLWVRFKQGYATAIKRMHQGNGKLMHDTASLDAPVGGSPDMSLAQCIPDSTCLEDDCVANVSTQSYMSRMTEDERNVAALISEGYTYREAGYTLGLSEAKVQTFVSRIRVKLAPIVYSV